MKKFLVAILVVCLVAAMMGTVAFAEENPVLTVTTEGNVNTLTYTLVGENATGVIYRYVGTEAVGNDYDAKFEVTAGGNPIVDTVNWNTTYSYVLEQNFAEEQDVANGKSENEYGVATTVTMDRASVKIALVKGQGDNWHTEWMICDPFTATVGGSDYRTKNIPGWCDHNGDISYPDAEFAFGGEDADVLQLTDNWNEGNGVLKAGTTYNLQFTAYVVDGSGNFLSWGSSYVTVTAPLYRDSEVVTTEIGEGEGNEPGGNDPIQGTADISTIAFALAAVVGSGALIIRKKR